MVDIASSQDSDGLELSVIIPTCNRAAVIMQNLQALSRQVLPAAAFEVLVCDDASQDDTWQLLQDFQAPFALRLFRLERRGGPGKARNLLIREARAQNLVILNDDAILTPPGLAIHAEGLKAVGHQKIGILGKLSFPKDFQRMPLGYLLEFTDLSFRYSLYESGNLYGGSAFYSCNLGFRRQILLDVGLFDEGYPGAGAEDMELGDRLARQGHAVLYLEACLALHEHRLSIHDFCRSQIGRGGGGVVRFLRDLAKVCHYDAITPDSLHDLRQSLNEAAPAIEELKDAVHAIHLYCDLHASVTDGANIPWREAPLEYPSHAQWQMNSAEIKAHTRRALNEAVCLLRCRTLRYETLARLYQVCCFLKWRYDTVGIAQSPWIDEFAAQTEERRQARNLSAAS